MNTKRFLALLLAIATVLCFVACGDDEKEDKKDGGNKTSYAGRYECKALGMGDFVIDPGDGTYLELVHGGTGSMAMEGESVPAEWKVEGDKISVTADGETVTGTVKDGVIHLSVDGVDMWFLAEGAALPADVQAAIENNDLNFGEDSSPEAEGGESDTPTAESEDVVIGGSESETEGGNALYAGDYECKAVGMGALVVDPGEGAVLKLLEDGTGSMTMDGETMPAEWKVDGETVSVTADGETITGTVKDGVIHLSAEGVDMWFLAEGATLPADVQAAIDATMGGETEGSYLDWWNGDWYGWEIFTETTGGHTNLQDTWGDCCANIELDENGSGTITLWDASSSKDSALMVIDVSCVVDESTGEYGVLVIEGGAFLDTEIDTDVTIDPAKYSAENFIEISLEYADDNGTFTYTCFLRPWGQDWTDIIEDAGDLPYTDMTPYYYNEWYVPHVLADSPMPDTIDLDNVPQSGGTDTPATDDSITEADPNAMEMDIFTVVLPETASVGEDIWGDPRIEDNDDRYKFSVFGHDYDAEGVESTRADYEDYKTWEGYTVSIEEYGAIGGFEDVVVCYSDCILCADVYFSIKFDEDIELYSGIELHFTSETLSSEEIMELDEVQAIINSIRF